MDLLQYRFELDPGYRMDAVRERVAAKRHLLDGLPGLRWKAWMLAEPLPGRSQPKCYAPLYLFDDAPSTLAFLQGDIYKGVTDTFGWPMPLHGTALGPVPASIAGARSCRLRTTRLHDYAALRAAVAATTAAGEALQFDVSRMLLRRYSFSAAAPHELEAADAEAVYEVVAVSAPSPSAR
jgi:hypothetical protein